MTVTVDESMTARFDDEDVHPVYGTAALVQHLEQVSRRMLKPHLEPGEEGVGRRIEVLHEAPVAVGETVELTATVASVTARALVTRVSARCKGRVVARGLFEQAVVDVAAWRRRAATPPPPPAGG
jgi:predicted thioesterase